MPNCITHYLHAKLVLSKLPKELNQRLNRNAYFWAAQGPDFLFCSSYFPWSSVTVQYGSKIHETSPSLIFNVMKKYLLTHQDNILIESYIIGFVNHYALDSIVHPYVNALASKLVDDDSSQNERSLHIDIESSIDTILLRKETGKLPSEVKLKTFFPKDKEVQLEIAKLYKYLILELFDDNIDELVLYNLTKDTRTAFSLLTDSTTLKKKIVSRLEKGSPKYVSGHILPFIEDANIDYINANALPWIDEQGKSSTKTFFELFDEATVQSLKIIEHFSECDFTEITKERTMG